MIHESAPWKKRLAKDADLIERWAAKTAMAERRSDILEQKIFLAAYAMRKLVEAHKVSSSFSDRSIHCETFEGRSERVSSVNNHRIDKLYDLERPKKCAVGTRSLLDIIIHSLVFSEVIRDDLSVSGFLVTSERQQTVLWLVDIQAFVTLMRTVAADYPSYAIRVFDEEGRP